MNIEFPVAGGFKSEQRADGIEIWTLSIPVFFTEISTVKNPAVLDCNLRSFVSTSHGQEFRLGQSAVRAFNGANDGSLIQTRPITLKEQDGDRNPLNLEFRVAPPRDTSAEDKTADFDLVLRLTFSSMTWIDIRLGITVDKTLGTLNIREWDRLEDPKPMLRNLGLLAFSIVLLGVWNFTLNKDVYQRPSFLEPSVVSLVLGAALAFFGLSFSRIQSWFKTLANLSGLVRWPEIHLDTSAGRLFAQPWISKPLWALSGLSVLFVILNYPQTLPEVPSRYAVIDSDGRPVDTQEIYLRHILTRGFPIVCSRTGSDTEPVPMGSLSAGWRKARLRPEPFLLRYPPYLASLDRTEPPASSEDLMERPVGGLELLEFDLDRQEDVLVPFLCNSDHQRSTELQVQWSSDSLPPHSFTAKKRPRAIEVVPRPPLDLVFLERKLYAFRHETLRNLERPGDLWLQRERLAAELVQDLQSTKRWLEPQTVVAALENLVNEVDVQKHAERTQIVNPEQALERSILAQAVLRFYETRRRGRLERRHVQTVISLVTERFTKIHWRHSDWRATRSMWEILLRLEVLTNGNEPILHEAIVKTFDSANADAIAHYLASCVHLGVLRFERGVQARVEYFGRSWGRLSQLEGVLDLQDLANYVLRMERFPESLQPEVVHQWILSLFIPRTNTV